MEQGHQQCCAEVLRSGEFIDIALRDSAQLLRNGNLFKHLPQTEAHASAVFKIAVRVQALMHHQLIMHTRRWPWRLVDIVNSDEVERSIAILELLSAPQCLLDSFSRKVREEWPEAEQIASPIGQAQLRIALQQLTGTVYGTERLHSVNQRRAHSRRLTTNLRAHDLGSYHAGSAQPVCSGELFQPKLVTSKKRPCTDQAQGRREVKKRKGGGGAMRAFMHIRAQELSGQQGQGRFDFKELHRQYAALTAEQKTFYENLGRAAQQLHKDGLQSFPDTFRAARQKLEKENSMSVPPVVGPFSRPSLKTLKQRKGSHNSVLFLAEMGF